MHLTVVMSVFAGVGQVVLVRNDARATYQGLARLDVTAGYGTLQYACIRDQESLPELNGIPFAWVDNWSLSYNRTFFNVCVCVCVCVCVFNYLNNWSRGGR